MTPSESEDEKRSATIAAVLGDIFDRASLDLQTREAAAQLMAHLYKNGHRSADQLKAALSPATLQARFG